MSFRLLNKKFKYIEFYIFVFLWEIGVMWRIFKKPYKITIERKTEIHARTGWQKPIL